MDYALITAKKPLGRIIIHLILDVTDRSRPSSEIDEDVHRLLHNLAHSVSFAGKWQLVGVRKNNIGLLELPGINFKVKKLHGHQAPVSSLCIPGQ